MSLDKQDEPGPTRMYPLQGLKTRTSDDPTIALLDAWATVADVLTFYQERIANEGYLRTATERRSVLELARLVGYQPRPGVASSVYLAYTLDDNVKEDTIIPKGARAQSVPGPGELPQSFETSEDLKARAKWNNLKPRMTQPQTKESIQAGDGTKQHIYLKGISTNLKPNDPLLIDFGTGTPEFHRIKEVQPNAIADCTLVIVQAPDTGQAHTTASEKDESPDVSLIKALTLHPSIQPRNSLHLAQRLEGQFTPKAEAGYRSVSTFAPVLRETLATAAANAKVTPESRIKVYALRLTAPLFGGIAPKKPLKLNEATKVLETIEWGLSDIEQSEEVGIKSNKERFSATVFLDAGYDKVLPNSWIVVDTSAVVFDTNNKTHQIKPPDNPILIAKAKSSQANTARAAYGMSGKTTRIELIDHTNSTQKEWVTIPPPSVIGIADAAAPAGLSDDFQIIRQTVVYAQSEELGLAEEPIDVAICGAEQEIIELDGFYEGLEAGRWVIVFGERKIEGTSGVRFSELAMLATVAQDVQQRQQPPGTDGTSPSLTPLAGDKLHTFIKLAGKLEYCFKRETVTIYGNVVKATHGETRKEVLGSGDGAKALQSFVLKQPPLTFVSASNPSGVDSTLKAFINDVQWQETDSPAGLSPTDRYFTTKTGDEGNTTVVFGNGREGARLPTGIENIKAEYRNGIGKPGNVKAGQITLLTTRPLGVKEVINPLRASGGADKETRDQARKNAPLAVKALDRLVSVQDYEDFARTYAGIGKARAMEIFDGHRQVVHITIAGADDIPIDTHSDLYRNLHQALLDCGDPYQAIQLEIRELMLIVISANIRILPEYQWEPVVIQVRSALLDTFGFDRRELGQDVLLSEVISVIQSVRGVAYVDVDTLGGIPEKKLEGGERRLLTPEEIAKTVQDLTTASEQSGPGHRIPVNLPIHEGQSGSIPPAQLAFLTPDVPEALILNQIT